MKSRLGLCLVGTVLLVMLAGCGRGLWHTGERAAWRHQAEVACMKSGAVKLGTSAVEIDPIEGPGVCGADFPLKVFALGESNSALGYADQQPPPDAYSTQMPRWPINDQAYPQPSPVQSEQVAPPSGRPIHGEVLRWVPGPPGIDRSQTNAPPSRPISLEPPRMNETVAPRAAPMPETPRAARRADDIPDDAILPPGRARAPDYSPVPRMQPAYNAPIYQPPPQRAVPPLGPPRAPPAIAQAKLTPPATLACPIVSALDRWVSEGVQPAALHWFGEPVTKIQQIGSYSCRSMIGAGTNHISEHAFGNALDIAGFTFADGRRITVKDGWHGTPEEQGFLHDVQLYACETFTTVLAPGYNIFHYNHIHVDLMRRRPGYRPCRPTAIPGEVVAARVRAHYANRHHAPAYTGSITPAAANAPLAVPGEDGYVPDDEDQAVTGSVSTPPDKDE
jgi:Extensin-like protein C-terminus